MLSRRQITIRISEILFQQIEDRAAIIGRSLNTEIEHLLTWAIDRQVAVDQMLMEKMRDRISKSDEEALVASPLPVAMETS